MLVTLSVCPTTGYVLGSLFLSVHYVASAQNTSEQRHVEEWSTLSTLERNGRDRKTMDKLGYILRLLLSLLR